MMMISAAHRTAAITARTVTLIESMKFAAEKYAIDN
jgi:hypothetical protein